jgi:hypothetical protein
MIINKIIKPKNKILIATLLFLGIILVDTSIFTQGYVWLAGNITYIFPLFLIIIYLYFNNYIFDKAKTFNTKQIIFFTILNFLSTMFVENASIIFISINLIFLLYYYFKYHKINNLFLYSLIASIIGFSLMYFSPGTHNRMLTDNKDFFEKNIFEKIAWNIPNFINYTFVNNIFMLILLIIPMNYLIINKIKNKIYKYCFLILTNCLVLLTIIAKVLSEINSYSISFIIDGNYLIVLAWILFMTLLIYLVIINKNNRDKILLYLSLGLINNLAMMLSPIWDGRTALITVFMFYIAGLILFNGINIKAKLSKYINIVLTWILSLIIIIYLILYNSVRLQSIDRDLSIKKQLSIKSKVIEIDAFPKYVMWDANPLDEYHLEVFKDYYHINQDVEIIIKPYNYKYLIFYK